jgi:hypothetical protein
MRVGAYSNTMHIPLVEDLPPVEKLTATQLLDEELSQRRKIWGGVASTSIHLGMAIVSHGTTAVSCIWAAYNLTRTVMRHRELKKEIKKRRLRCHRMRKRDRCVPLAISILTPGLGDMGGDLMNDVADSVGADQVFRVSSGGSGGGDEAPYQNSTQDLGSGGASGYQYSSQDFDSFYSPSDYSGSLSPDYDYFSGSQSWSNFEYNPNLTNANYSLPEYGPANLNTGGGGDWGSHAYTSPQDPNSFGFFGSSPSLGALPDFSIAMSTADPSAQGAPLSLASLVCHLRCCNISP